MGNSQQVPTATRVGVAVVCCTLIVFGVFEATTAYGFWGSWVAAVVLALAGLAGWIWVSRRDPGDRLAPRWLLGLMVVTALPVVLIVLAGVACNNETGFSCGG